MTKRRTRRYGPRVHPLRVGPPRSGDERRRASL
jgi:hypothetical protein